MYQCFNCGRSTAVWQTDFDYEDYGIDRLGVVHVLECMNCGAKIEYYCDCDDRYLDGTLKRKTRLFFKEFRRLHDKRISERQYESDSEKAMRKAYERISEQMDGAHMLYARLFEGVPVDDICKKFAMSRTNYYRKYNKALIDFANRLFFA